MRRNEFDKRAHCLRKQEFIVNEGISLINHASSLEEAALGVERSSPRVCIKGVQANGVCRPISRYVNGVLERLVSETLALMPHCDGHTSEIERALHGSEVPDVDCPRLFRDEAKGRKDSLAALSYAHARMTLRSGSSAFRYER